MGSLQDLLPDSDSSVLCSDFSRSLELDPVGTAIRADRIVLVETPLPWPKPVFNHPALNGVKEVFDQSSTATRVLASASSDEVASQVVSGGGVAVNVFDRNCVSSSDAISGLGGVSGSSNKTKEQVVDHYRFEVMAGDLLGFAELLAAHPIGAELSPQLSEVVRDQGPVTSPVLIVCTQGSHDICCGSKGMRFANDVEAIENAVVYKVSHTGGHRFAPTAMTLPDGRMWADLTVDKLAKILSKTTDVVDVVSSCRGWWGAERGAAQTAERAVWSQIGWSFDETDRSVRLRSEAGGGVAQEHRWVVESEGQQWEVIVSVGREVPTIACHSPGGLPAKSSIEYQVDSVRLLDSADEESEGPDRPTADQAPAADRSVQ